MAKIESMDITDAQWALLAEQSNDAFGRRYLVRAGYTEDLERGGVPRRFVGVEFSDVAKSRS